LATIFPASPAVNDTFKSDGTTWKWNGSAWTFFSGVGTVGGGGDATVAFQVDQPDTASLDAGALWIDSDEDAISGLLPATFTRWISVLSASATTLSGLDDNALSLIYTAGYEKVFINGTLLVRGSDYTATTGNTIVLTTAAESGDAVEVHSYESFQIADTYTQAAADAKFFAIDESRIDRWTKTYSASATTITGVDDYSESLLYTSGLESLFINGVLVDPSEYTRTSASVITPDEAILSGDVVDIITPKAFEVANTYTQAQIDNKYNTRTRWTKTYSASATVISGVDDNSLSLLYTAGYEEVYLNGILLTPITDYARTSASVVTLGAAVVTNDIIEIVNTQPFNVADVYNTSQSDNRYLTQSSASSTYLTPSSASSTYAPISTSGMTLVNSTQFSSQSTVSLDNVFNSTYTNYKILINTGDPASPQLVTMRLRSGSPASDITSAIHYRMNFGQGTTGATSLIGLTQTSFGLGYAGNGSHFMVSMDIFHPFDSTLKTAISGTGISNNSSYNGITGWTINNWYDATTSVNGFSILFGANTTGTIRVYGYRN